MTKLKNIVDTFTNWVEDTYIYLVRQTSDGKDYKVNLRDLTIKRPDTEPVVSTGVVTLDCEGVTEMIFEPKLSSGTRTINVDFTFAFTNDTYIVELVIRPQLTGTRVITFPSNVKCSNEGGGTWNDIAKTWTIAAGTDEIYNMSLEKDKQGSFYDLVIGGVPV